MTIIESPRSYRLPDNDLADTIDEYGNNDYFDDDPNEMYDDSNENEYNDSNENEYNNSNENEYDDSNENEGDMTPVITHTEIQIIHPPQKGITAWLNHVNSNIKRENLFSKLKSLVF